MVNKKTSELIKQLRKEFESETGKSYKDTYSFTRWLEENEHLEAQTKCRNAKTIIIRTTKD